MTDTDDLHVVSTTDDRVWLVHAETPDDAEEAVRNQYDTDPEILYYEGRLYEGVREANRDGVALLNP